MSERKMRAREQSVRMFRRSTLPELRLPIDNAKEKWNVEVGAIQAALPTLPRVHLTVIPSELALTFKPVLRAILQRLDQILAPFLTDKHKIVGDAFRQCAER